MKYIDLFLKVWYVNCINLYKFLIKMISVISPSFMKYVDLFLKVWYGNCINFYKFLNKNDISWNTVCSLFYILSAPLISKVTGCQKSPCSVYPA